MMMMMIASVTVATQYFQNTVKGNPTYSSTAVSRYMRST